MISTKIIADEAIKRGIKVQHINDYQTEMAFVELSFGKHFEYILGSNISRTNVSGDYAVKNKALTKSLLIRKNISVAKGKLFCHKDREEIDNFVDEIKYPIIIKPYNGAHGDLVSIVINNNKDCKEAVNLVLRKNNYVLVEKMFQGEEFRIIASREKVFAVAKKEAANVIGDGLSDIKELVKIKNRDARRGVGHDSPLTKIKIDSSVKQNLLEQKIDLNYIPQKDEKIYLRKNANLSTGGESVDVTDQIHPELKKIAVRAICAIPGLAYGGIDLLTNKEISEKPTKNSYIILEINSSPGLRMHHYPSIGKPRDVAKEIIDILFPETIGE